VLRIRRSEIKRLSFSARSDAMCYVPA
jgi:hypothetical protein